MTKDREERKKEKKERKEKQERKEKKRREAEELAVKEKKISKKHKSESKKAEKSEKSKRKSRKPESESESEIEVKSSKKKSRKPESESESEVEVKSPKKKSRKSESESESEVEVKSPKKKSKESKKKKQKRSDESEEPQTQTVDTHPVTVPVPIATTNKNESDSDFESDKEDIKNLLESYSKEELINLIYKTAEKGSRLVSAVLESADRDTAQRNIFVRGLGWDTTHENLKSAFEVYGEIEECSVVMDKDTGRAKGYGFVMFKTRKGAREALKNPEKRMYNRTVSCNLSQGKPFGAGKPREPREPREAREAIESVKIDLTQAANQSEMTGLDMAHGLDKGHQQHPNMPMYAGHNMPFYGHSQPPGFNPMYGAIMANQGAMMGGLPNYRMFGSGMMNQGPMVPPNGMGMAGQYVGDGNGNGNGNGVGPGFDGERAWYLR